MTGHQKGCRCARCIPLVGTTNEGFVADTSGNRRYWTVVAPRVVKVTFEDIRRAYLEALEKEEN